MHTACCRKRSAKSSASHPSRTCPIYTSVCFGPSSLLDSHPKLKFAHALATTLKRRTWALQEKLFAYFYRYSVSAFNFCNLLLAAEAFYYMSIATLPYKVESVYIDNIYGFNSIDLDPIANW